MVTPAAGGPAEGAGVKPQDTILAIGEKPTEGMSLYEAASLLQVCALSRCQHEGAYCPVVQGLGVLKYGRMVVTLRNRDELNRVAINMIHSAHHCENALVWNEP